jgi:hypothetical protein
MAKVLVALTGVVLVGIVAAAGVSPGTAVSAAAPGGKPAVGSPAAYMSAKERQVMREQLPYQELDVKVKRLAPTTDDTPLNGTLIDLEHHKFHVYWVGVVPRAVRELRSWARQHGITLVITQAAFTKRELMAASSRVVAFAESTRARLRIDLHTDGSGITVRSEGLPAAAVGGAAPTKAQAALLRVVDKVRATTGVPVAVADLPGSAQRASRSADFSPYWGGADIETPTTDACMDGFSAYAAGDTSIRHMLTVAHCTKFHDGYRVDNGAGTRMGYSEFVAQTYSNLPKGSRYDLATVHLDPGKWNSPRVYGNDSGSIRYSVYGYATNGIPAGGHYCVSLTVLAPRCNLLSGQQFEGCADGICTLYINIVNTDGQNIWCPGDSGGPIYYWDYYFQGIYAAGLVGWLDNGGWCGKTGGASVVATAVQLMPGLTILTV